jgi:septal ring factor EnvC (AmiA/AmiB activator)
MCAEKVFDYLSD